MRGGCSGGVDLGAMSGYSLEQLYEVWNDGDGCCIEIGPDRDGLDLVEIRAKDEKGVTYSRITMNKEQAKLVAEAINRACNQ